METKVDTKALTELALKPQIIELPVQGGQAVALPPGWSHTIVKPDEKLLPAPSRINRNVVAHEIGGFISYVNHFKSGLTALFCTEDTKPSLLARLDDHQPGKPSHVEHTVIYGCPTTEEWGRWLGMNRKLVNQKALAEFIEENIRDVVEPTGIDFLTAVTNFAETRQVEFSSATRLSDGTMQFNYSEKDTAQQVRFPTKIKIAMPIFMGVPTLYSLDARVKYRLKDGDLTLWYELDRPDLVKRAAYEELLNDVTKQTSIIVHRAL